MLTLSFWIVNLDFRKLLNLKISKPKTEAWAQGVKLEIFHFSFWAPFSRTQTPYSTTLKILLALSFSNAIIDFRKHLNFKISKTKSETWAHSLFVYLLLGHLSISCSSIYFLLYQAFLCILRYPGDRIRYPSWTSKFRSRYLAGGQRIR